MKLTVAMFLLVIAGSSPAFSQAVPFTLPAAGSPGFEKGVKTCFVDVGSAGFTLQTANYPTGTLLGISTTSGVGTIAAGGNACATSDPPNWIVRPNNAVAASSPCGKNPNANLGFFPVVRFSGDRTVLLSDQCTVFVYTGSGGNTLTMPDPTTAAGFVIWVQNLGTGSLTIAPGAGQINLGSSVNVAVGSSGMLDSDGTLTSWFFLTNGGGGGTACGTNGIAGQDCVSTGGGGAQWSQEIIAPNAIASGNPGLNVTLTAGNGLDTGNGGNVNITGGQNGATSFTVGGVDITGGTAIGGEGATGGSVTVAGGAGDDVGGGTGGNVLVAAGAGGVTGIGPSGNVTIQVPDGFSGGGLSVLGGAATSSGHAGTSIQVIGGSNNAITFSQPVLQGYIGQSTLSFGLPGEMDIFTGNAVGAADSGPLVISSGKPGSPDRAGNVYVTTGGTNSPVDASPSAGIIYIQPGPSGAAGATTSIWGGPGTQTGGTVLISGGQSLGTASGAGGDAIIQGGPVNDGHDDKAGNVIFRTSLDSATATNRSFGVVETQSHFALPNRSPFFVPVVSSCNSATVDANSSDMGGTVTVPSGSTTACTITFQQLYRSAPRCLAQVRGSTPIASSVSAVSTSAVTWAFASSIGGTSFDYFCFQ